MKGKKQNQGFSLVEIIVAISIMAVLIAVLIPSMLYYTERSRAQRDITTMDEVVNSVFLALCSDQNIYDEILTYAAFGNFSCYVDTPTTSGITERIVTQEPRNGRKEQFMFGDSARRLDEAVYYAAGNMRGMTLTFQPEMIEGQPVFVMKNAVINKYIQDDTEDGINTSVPTTDRAETADNIVYVNQTPDYEVKGTLGSMTSADSSTPYFYHRLRSVDGNKIEITSQTYRNSEYTIFIRMGRTGGNKDTTQQSIVVYGQWNGTNLPRYS